MLPLHLLTVATLFISRVHSLPHISTRQDTPSPNATAGSANIVDQTIVNKLDDIRSRWGIKGINVVLVASPEYMGHKTGTNTTEWATQSIALGQANRFGDEFTDETLYALGSNSKHFAAVAVALLIENGTVLPNGEPLTYTTKVKDILPEFGLLDEYAGQNAELVDLLSMRSGLPRHDHLMGLDVEEVVSRMKYLRPSTPFRHDGQYQSLHYIVMDQVVSTLTGTSFVDFVQTHMFDPLGMTNTYHNHTQAVESGLSVADGWVHEDIDLEGCLAASQETDGVRIGTTGSAITNSQDMFKWLKEELSPSILPPTIIPATVTSQTILTKKPVIPGITSSYTYGLGQFMYTYRGYAINGHDGSVWGQLSHNTRVPDVGVGFVVIVNDQAYGDLMCSMVEHILLDAILGLAEINWELDTFTGLAGDVSTESTDSSTSQNSASPATSSDNSTSASASETAPSPRPPLGAESIVGKYTDEAYGTFDIQPLSNLQDPEIILAFNKTFTLLDLPLGNNTYYYENTDSSSFITHYIFTPFDGPIFNVTASYVAPLYPDGSETKNGSTVISYGPGSAVFKDDGVGLFGIWQAGSGVPAREVVEVDVENQAEVWLRKV
uniref:Beta-lactamase-related domain-containing protein n=1 Tax=Kwoniella bestiolae CBS 10118 TaxID=1296100 RepID=A0A1B9FV95_9TREE|nr:hypothetical protein I302_08329 [Kwoniella bestiolae CBS 10118]OCF22678.1 hypothetical protein I302_08329 [Kwoniella bestiolae CBS 10118]